MVHRAGLEPRSPRPWRSPGRLELSIERQILQLRKRGWDPMQIPLALGIGHSSVHQPESNGKVERFFRTLDEECFAVHQPRSSKCRMRLLDEFFWYYNHQQASSEACRA